MKTRTQTLALAACALLISFSGCSTDARTLQLRSVSPAPRLAPAPWSAVDAPPAAVLSIHWAPLEDRRLDPTVIGGIGRPLLAPDVRRWVEEGLHQLNWPRVATASDAAAADLVLKPRLLKAYVHGVDVTKSAIVVLEIEYHRSGQAHFTRTYRGRQANMNWWNSETELAGALHHALLDCLRQVVADVAARVPAPPAVSR